MFAAGREAVAHTTQTLNVSSITLPQRSSGGDSLALCPFRAEAIQGQTVRNGDTWWGACCIG